MLNTPTNMTKTWLQQISFKFETIYCVLQLWCRLLHMNSLKHFHNTKIFCDIEKNQFPSIPQKITHVYYINNILHPSMIYPKQTKVKKSWLWYYIVDNIRREIIMRSNNTLLVQCTWKNKNQQKKKTIYCLFDCLSLMLKRTLMCKSAIHMHIKALHCHYNKMNWSEQAWSPKWNVKETKLINYIYIVYIGIHK